VISDPFSLPDGSEVPLPPQGFQSWEARRDWENNQRRGWQLTHGLPGTGLPGLHDPFILPGGASIPLPGQGFRSWPERQAWEAQQRDVWRQGGGVHPMATPAAVHLAAAYERSRFHGEFGTEFGVAPPPPPTGVNGVPFSVINAQHGGAAPPPPPTGVNGVPFSAINARPAPPPPPPPVPGGALGGGLLGGAFGQLADFADQTAFDAAQATDDASQGIIPPPVFGPGGQFIPAVDAGLGTAPPYAPQGYGYGGYGTNAYAPQQPWGRPQGRRGWGRFFGDFGDDTITASAPSPVAAAQQLAGAAIGVGAQALPSKEKKDALNVAAGHPHTLAGLVGSGFASFFHRAAAELHTWIYPSRKDPVTGATTLAPIEIKG